MSEARTTKWAHLDLGQGIWFKPTTKNGMSQRIPLTRQAIAALEAMPRRRRLLCVHGPVRPLLVPLCRRKAWGIFRKGPACRI